MASVVDELPPSGRRKRGSKYERFLDGQVWKLTRGEDFDISFGNVRMAIYNAGKRRGLKVTGRVVGDDLYVQALPRKDGAA